MNELWALVEPGLNTVTSSATSVCTFVEETTDWIQDVMSNLPSAVQLPLMLTMQSLLQAAESNYDLSSGLMGKLPSVMSAADAVNVVIDKIRNSETDLLALIISQANTMLDTAMSSLDFSTFLDGINIDSISSTLDCPDFPGIASDSIPLLSSF